MRLAMPYLKGVDFKFEGLSDSDRKNLIEDLKNNIPVSSFYGDPVKWDDLVEIEKNQVNLSKDCHPVKINYRYNQNKHTIEKIISAKSVVSSFLKLSGYDREIIKPGYKGKFVIHDHKAIKAGQHFDLRIEFPVASLHQALKGYEGKRLPGTPEPLKEFPDKPGTVYRSFAVKKYTLPTSSTKLFIVETEDHPISYGSFQGTIPEGYGAGEVEIFDKGTYELINVEGDKKYTINFKGKKLSGIFALVKYKNGYLWVKTKDQPKEASVDWSKCTETELDFAAALGLGPKYVPQPIKTIECTECHNNNAYYREDHPDTDMAEIVLFCPDCKKSKTASIHDRSVKPSFFSNTHYRLPTEEELKEIHSFDLSPKELIEGFGYTIVGRGIMRSQQKNDIIKSIRMLCEMYPKKTYQDALKLAYEINSK